MAYANVRSFTVDHTKVPSNQSNFPVLFTAVCDTLNGAINNSVTAIVTTSGKQLQVGDYLKIDSETMLVTAGSAGSYTVNRAALGSSAASHADLAPITNLFLASVANGGGVTSASGFDIIFATDNAGASPVAYERVLWTAASGMLEAHVLLATASSSVDAVLYILWGDAGVTTDQSNPTAVWDANFKLIAHLPDGTTLSVADTTGLNTGTNSGATAAAGKVDGAAGFDAVSKFVDYGAGSDLDITGDITAECWVFATTTSINVILARMNGLVQTNGYQYYINGNSVVCEYRNASAIPDFIQTNFAIGGNVWAHVAMKRTSGTMKVLVNGTDPGIGSSRNQGSSTTGSVSDTFFVAKNAGGFFWGGIIDEMRMSNIARSDDWIIASFNAQGAPNTFYSLGVTTGPPPPTGNIVPLVMHNRRMQNAA